MNNELNKTLNDSDMDDFDYDFLPGSIKMIAEVIGVKEARNIANMMAKKDIKKIKVYFPKKPKENSFLRGVISDASLMKIHEAFKGDKIDLTSCRRWKEAKIKREIHRLKAKQFTAKDIAKKTGFHLATVYRELARRRGEN